MVTLRRYDTEVRIFFAWLLLIDSFQFRPAFIRGRPSQQLPSACLPCVTVNFDL